MQSGQCLSGVRSFRCPSKRSVCTMRQCQCNRGSHERCGTKRRFSNVTEAPYKATKKKFAHAAKRRHLQSEACLARILDQGQRLLASGLPWNGLVESLHELQRVRYCIRRHNMDRCCGLVTSEVRSACDDVSAALLQVCMRESKILEYQRMLLFSWH
jgi:hypothetical protein